MSQILTTILLTIFYHPILINPTPSQFSTHRCSNLSIAHTACRAREQHGPAAMTCHKAFNCS